MASRRAILLGLTASLAASRAPRLDARQSRRAPVEPIARRVADDYLSRPEIMLYRVDDVRAVHYAEIASAYGLARLAHDLGDPALLRRVAERYRRIAALPNSANHVDANVCGVLPLEIAQQNGDAAALAAGLKLADSQWQATDPDGLTRQARYWVDDVWMIGLLQLQAWRATAAQRYLDRAALMASLYLARLQQPNGLFHHGAQAPFFWGRGNGWVAAGLAELLSELPVSHARRPVILAGYRGMMDALRRRQTPSGLWRQLIDHPAAWEESSASAMFAFAFARGLRLKLLTEAGYRDAVARAWRGLAARTDALGRLSGICVGTGQSADEVYYLSRPAAAGDLHGQAPMLWLAAELAGS